MENKKLWLGIVLVMMLVFGIILTGCPAELDEPATYTVWTGSFNFSSTDSDFGSLQDGYFLHKELTQTSFNWEKENNFQNKSQYVWTEDQLYSYFIGMGFSSTTAKTESKWLISVNHGLIGVREGSTLRLILK